MSCHLGQMSLFVRNYDEAIHYYCSTLGFTLISDERVGDKRWVVVSPNPSGQGAAIQLVQANNDTQKALIGGQGAGKVWLFLYTDDFATDHQRFVQAGVTFLEQPRHETYGSVAVFEDLYGNRWDLMQRKLC